MLGGGIYLVFLPIKKEISEKRKADISKLTEEEKNIYQLLKEQSGSLYQSDLLKETEFSKVHLTRVLDKLETKNILERKPMAPSSPNPAWILTSG